MRTRSAALTAAALLALSLTACTSSPTSPPTVIADFSSAAQSSTVIPVDVPLGGVVAITTPNPANLEAKYWHASIADSKIVTFHPADSSGRAATEPMFTADHAGKTIAVLRYSGGQTPSQATFEITVIAP